MMGVKTRATGALVIAAAFAAISCQTETPGIGVDYIDDHCTGPECEKRVCTDDAHCPWGQLCDGDRCTMRCLFERGPANLCAETAGCLWWAQLSQYLCFPTCRGSLEWCEDGLECTRTSTITREFKKLCL